MNSSDFIKVTITNSQNEDYSVERRFKKDITIQEFKNKLELLVGYQAHKMKLEVYDKNEDIVCKPNELDKYLYSYPIKDGMQVRVVNTNEDDDDDESTVPKFELSDEVYARMPLTVQSFLKENKLGKYNEDKVKQMEEIKRLELENEKVLISTMKINDRCEVIVSGHPKRRASIMYLGLTQFSSGYWVGVKYDEPLGKNNGSVAGVKYFECSDKYGGFIKPSNIIVGDFPEEDDELNEL